MERLEFPARAMLCNCEQGVAVKGAMLGWQGASSSS